MVAAKTCTFRQGCDVVELTNTIDILTKISNKCAHDKVLILNSTQ